MKTAKFNGLPLPIYLYNREIFVHYCMITCSSIHAIIHDVNDRNIKTLFDDVQQLTLEKIYWYEYNRFENISFNTYYIQKLWNLNRVTFKKFIRKVSKQMPGLLTEITTKIKKTVETTEKRTENG